MLKLKNNWKINLLSFSYHIFYWHKYDTEDLFFLQNEIYKNPPTYFVWSFLRYLVGSTCHKFCQMCNPEELKRAMYRVAFVGGSPARNILEQPSIPWGLQRDRPSSFASIH